MAEKTVIDVRNVCKTYFMDGGTSQSVLKDINFQIKSGEFVAIMGPSGSGKSTLMNILGCLDKPTSGKYILEGYDIAAKDDNELAAIRGKTIGFVFQNFNLMMKRTIADNVSLPLIYQKVGEDERYKRALEMLDKVNLTGYQDRPPSADFRRYATACRHRPRIDKQSGDYLCRRTDRQSGQQNF